MAESKKPFRTFSVRSLLIVVTLVALGLFAKQKWTDHVELNLAREWSAKCSTGVIEFPEDAPVIRILERGVLELEESRERFGCLKLLVEQNAARSLEPLLKIAFATKDREIRIAAIHLIGFHRDIEAIERLVRLHKKVELDAETRAAIIDSVGITRGITEIKPSGLQLYSLSLEGIKGTERIDGLHSLPIMQATQARMDSAGSEVTRQFSQMFDPTAARVKLEDFPEHFQYRLEKQMLEGESPEERAAAARAIVSSPPEDYKLRVAEWGVWINVDGEFQLAQSVIDEIPEFVHRSGNRLESFAGRVSAMMFITKPVIHFTASKPMAVDLEVLMAGGRPWFVYPRPDDFALKTTHKWRNPGQVAGVSENDRRQFGLDQFDGDSELDDLHEGYPWNGQQHRTHMIMRRGMMGNAQTPQNDTTAIDGLGLRWQSMILSPKKLPWMKLPEVTDDPKFQWWKDLRDVECTWVSNRNESERFAYYDGPTLANSPKLFELDGNKLKVRSQPMYEKNLLSLESKFDHANREHSGMYLEVDSDGRLSGQAVNLKAGQDIEVEKEALLNAEKTKEQMLTQVIEAGLTKIEAEALLKCWDQAFFKDPGKRVVYILDRSEYDFMCPITVRPKPTELERVGLVITSLKD